LNRIINAKITLATALLAAALALAGCYGTATASRSSADLSENEKHKLYSAALAATDAPLESDVFKDVCRKIGIFDSQGRPNKDYMSFVSAHVAWAMKSENEQFRAEINSREKAREYIAKHLPRQ
jgi:hypothetical protein